VLYFWLFLIKSSSPKESERTAIVLTNDLSFEGTAKSFPWLKTAVIVPLLFQLIGLSAKIPIKLKASRGMVSINNEEHS